MKHSISIKQLVEKDAEKLLLLEERNRDFFQLYTPLRLDSFYTLEGQLERIHSFMKEAEEDTGYHYGIFKSETGTLLGTLGFTSVVRGPLQSCWIGYSLDREQNGKGYTTEAVNQAVNIAFQELKLHRIEAGVMPHHGASMKVLQKAGFHKEGIARQSVKINGKWEDHQTLAILNPEDS
ncbi:GNAT family N-acetyltransferase [Bacillus lacus]|uniref:GNAT family N-acetyltransferase n=1 Tax=Metabacillus lacus TaxID=1983721 RepID=A0A7X2J2U2_9BACI|nr:GNAT family protein [Metabacillus lacus]MRX74336.1 GNAT family N-acetyltransferase [Metabacillus lacus]